MVPAELQNKIRDYFEFLWSHDIENEPLRLDMLPDSLQVLVQLQFCSLLILCCLISPPSMLTVLHGGPSRWRWRSR